MTAAGRPIKLVTTTEAAEMCECSSKKFLREAELHFVNPQQAVGRKLMWWKAEIATLATQLRRETRERAREKRELATTA